MLTANDIANDTIIGRRVFTRWNPCRRGVVTAVDHGCNALVLVRFDGSDYSTHMVPSDMAFDVPGDHPSATSH